MAEISPVDVSQHGPVTVMQLTRWQARNAINAETALALREAWLAFEADEQARVGILTGGDQVFCAGADLYDMAGLAPGVIGPNGPLGLTRLLGNKPMLAAIAGYCVAGGLELACWCDVRIADETAILGCFERRFGVPLIDGGTQRLPQIIGLGRALELILTGRPVPAREALSMGLVNEVVAPGQSLQRALEMAQLIATWPQTCLRNDRQAVYRGLGNDLLMEGLKIEAELGQHTLQSGEAFAGAQQFQTGIGRKGV
jgi:enoyl-CoA hydratase/carnithine racemase